jgi:hypothetical protein
MIMFRIECFCDDKRLAQVLRVLTGLVIGSPAVAPVLNAEQEKGGRIKQASNGKLIDLFSAHLKKDNPETINARYVKSFLQEIGSSPLSYSHVLKQAIDSKLVRKTGKGTRSKYTVLS